MSIDGLISLLASQWQLTPLFLGIELETDLKEAT